MVAAERTRRCCRGRRPLRRGFVSSSRAGRGGALACAAELVVVLPLPPLPTELVTSPSTWWLRHRHVPSLLIGCCHCEERGGAPWSCRPPPPPNPRYSVASPPPRPTRSAAAFPASLDVAAARREEGHHGAIYRRPLVDHGGWSRGAVSWCSFATGCHRWIEESRGRDFIFASGN